MRTRFAFACSALTAAMLVSAVLAATTSGLGSGYPAAAAQGPATAGHPVAGRLPRRAPEPSDCTNPEASLHPQGPLPAPEQMPPGSTMARIAARGYLMVGVLEDTPPMAYRDINSLRLQGFDIDIVEDIARAIFGDRTSEPVVFRPLVEADRIEAVRSGQVDLAVVAASITCPLRQQVDFSTVYYEAGQKVLVDRGSGFTGIGDLGGKRVCATRDSTSLMHLQTAASKPVPVSADTNTDCLMRLQLGEVDAVSTDDTILAGMMAQDLRTEVVGPAFSREPYGVEISKDTPDLVRFVNAVLERRVEDGRWLASYQKWLELALGSPPAPPRPQYRD